MMSHAQCHDIEVATGIDVPRDISRAYFGRNRSAIIGLRVSSSQDDLQTGISPVFREKSEEKLRAIAHNINKRAALDRKQISPFVPRVSIWEEKGRRRRFHSSNQAIQ
jgi:hypothetical protein